MKISVLTAKRSLCKRSLADFCRIFWPIVAPNEELKWNWHIDILCESTQQTYERIFRGEAKEYDLVTNIPPGTSKSTVKSVMAPAWAWTRMPNFAFLGASYAADLAEDLARKNRDIVKCSLYRSLFPEVVIRPDQDTKSKFMTMAGGLRCAVGSLGSVTGFHFHHICLPYESEIVTDLGVFPIGQIVANRMQVNIMSFDHDTGCCRWQPIEKYEVQPGRPLCRVVFTNGSTLELTHDHQVYVVGRGYVDAEALSPGERVYDGKEGLASGELCVVRQGVPLSAKEDSQLKEWQALLRWQMFSQCQVHSQKALRGLQQALCMESPLLFDKMSNVSSAWSKQSKMGRAKEDRMQLVWNRNGNDRQYDQAKEDTLLLQGMCRSSTLTEDERQEELQLSSWSESPSLLTGVCSKTECDSFQGELGLFSLRGRRAEQWSEALCSPYRLSEEQQQERKSSFTVQGLSWANAHQKYPPQSGIGYKVVSHVERAVRIPEKVYNLRVAQDHNYFAEGVLVHNCVDDPLDPKRAASKAELYHVNQWITGTLLQRKKDHEGSVIDLVMQRLHQDDPSANMVKNTRVKHYCIPATLEGEVKPAYLKSKYKDGLMDPIRLPQSVLDEKRQPNALGEYGYAAQYLQRPVPVGGGTFKVGQLRWSPIPEKFKRVVRFWDNAATNSKKACYSCGVKMGEDTEGGIWILDMRRGQWDTATRERHKAQIARHDGKHVVIGLEQEPGSAGKDTSLVTVKNLKGFTVKIFTARGSKEQRADAFSTQVNGGNVSLPQRMRQGDSWAGWAKEVVDELEYWPFSTFLDIGDAAAGAYGMLVKGLTRVGPLKRKAQTKAIFNGQLV